jgi:hypothetical protein
MIHFSIFKTFKLRAYVGKVRELLLPRTSCLSLDTKQHLIYIKHCVFTMYVSSRICLLPRTGTCEDILERQLMMAKLDRNIHCEYTMFDVN